MVCYRWYYGDSVDGDGSKDVGEARLRTKDDETSDALGCPEPPLATGASRNSCQQMSSAADTGQVSDRLLSI